MLKKKVLVKGINNLSDARYCAGMGVHFLCFDLDPQNENTLPNDKIKEIKNWLVGVTIGLDISELDSVDMVEVQKLEPDFLIINEGQIAQFNGLLPLFIFSNENGFSENVIISNVEEDRYENLTENHFVNNHWNEEQISQLLQKDYPFGIVLSGGKESRPGFSDYGDLMEILELLED